MQYQNVQPARTKGVPVVPVEMKTPTCECEVAQTRSASIEFVEERDLSNMKLLAVEDIDWSVIRVGRAFDSLTRILIRVKPFPFLLIFKDQHEKY